VTKKSCLELFKTGRGAIGEPVNFINIIGQEDESILWELFCIDAPRAIWASALTALKSQATLFSSFNNVAFLVTFLVGCGI